MDICNDVLANNESNNVLPILTKGTEGSWGGIAPRKLFLEEIGNQMVIPIFLIILQILF